MLCAIRCQKPKRQIKRVSSATSDYPVVNPRLPEVFRVTLIPEVGYIIPQSNFVNYAAPRIEKANFPPVLYVFEVKESIYDIFTDLSCLRDLDILGQLPVLLPIFALIADTVTLVAFIFAISTFFMFSRSRNPFLAVSRSYHVWVTSKIQVNFRFYMSSRVLMIGSYGFLKFLHSLRFRGRGIHFL